MALYWHVQNKDELLAAMGQSFFDGIGQRYAGPGRWDDQNTRRPRESLIETLRKHPASAMLTLGQVLRCEEGQEIAEFTLDVLRTAGFDVVEAAEIARLALQIAIMLVTQQLGKSWRWRPRNVTRSWPKSAPPFGSFRSIDSRGSSRLPMR